MQTIGQGRIVTAGPVTRYSASAGWVGSFVAVPLLATTLLVTRLEPAAAAGQPLLMMAGATVMLVVVIAGVLIAWCDVIRGSRVVEIDRAAQELRLVGRRVWGARTCRTIPFAQIIDAGLCQSASRCAAFAVLLSREEVDLLPRGTASELCEAVAADIKLSLQRHYGRLVRRAGSRPRLMFG